MKRLVLIAAVAALSACNQNKDEPAAAPSEAATTPAAVAAATTAATEAGTYDYTYEGKATTTVMKDDGTYEDTQDGKVIEAGKWSNKDGKTCFADDKGNPEKCWTTTEPDAEGNFTATSVDGKTVLKIKKTTTS